MRRTATTIVCWIAIVVIVVGATVLATNRILHQRQTIGSLRVELAAAQKENRDREGKCATAYLWAVLVNGDGEDMQRIIKGMPKGRGG